MAYHLYMTKSSNTQTPVEKLIEQADELRGERPIIWAILRGRGGELRIAQLLGMTMKQVQSAAATEQKMGAIKRTQHGAWTLDPKFAGYDSFKRVRAYYQKVDLKLLDDHLFDVEMAELCSVARQEARVRLADTKKRPEKSKAVAPTETQGALLRAILQAGLPGKGGGEHFSAQQIAKAQGRTGVGWTNKYMETLARRGFAIDEKVGSRRYWKLTPLGMEWAATDPSEEA